ncbi:MAG: ABC transporter permease [Epulopiscium sp. Nele67-Bin004]|nr:MAG: ABC transporter permease [Epulopiscium sp. Nele67-Bin004]
MNKIVVACLLSILVILLGIGIGSTFILPWEVANIMAHKIFGAQLLDSVTSTHISIVWNIRTVRTLMAFVVGAAIAASGSAMQSVMQNPLASSYTLGVSAGASVAAGLAMITGVSFFGILTLPFFGMIAGVSTVVLVVLLASKFDRNMGNFTIILLGMVVSLFLNAIITIINALFRENMQRLVYWQMGSFSGKAPLELLVITILTIIGVFLLTLHARELDILTFGETEAFSIGVDVKKAKWKILVLSAGLTGSAISFVGIIGFVDLIAPHVVRKLFGSSHKIVIPMSAIFGGIFMVCADIIARVAIESIDLPIGAVTALMGAPFFMYIFFRGGKYA